MITFENIDAMKKYFTELRVAHSDVWNEKNIGLGIWWNENEDKAPLPANTNESHAPPPFISGWNCPVYFHSSKYQHRQQS